MKRARTMAQRERIEMERAARFKPGDRVNVLHEGLGTVLDCSAYSIGVKLDSDGFEVDASHEQTELA